jgi:hypothetical protein
MRLSSIGNAFRTAGLMIADTVEEEADYQGGARRRALEYVVSDVASVAHVANSGNR